MDGRPQLGDRLGNYVLERALGSGGMGTVFAARDELLHRRVAVKLLHGGSEDALLAEARALAALDHPNAVRVYGLEHAEGRSFVVTELVDGVSLDHVLAEKRRLPCHQVVEVVRSVADALSAIHEAGRVHGDVKPSNILREHRTGRVLLTDFGLSRPVAEAAGGPLVRGTPGYIAPELARGACVPRELRTRADVYSLAATAFELLTGRLPFEHEDERALVWMQAFAEPPPPSAFLPSLGWRVDAALLGALRKDPRARTPTPACFAADLVRGISGGHAPARILIADDDEPYRTLVAIGLTKRLGHVVVEAVPDGERAYRAATARCPDLAVIDLDMPGLNGVELLLALRAAPGLGRLPVIVVSGRADGRERELLARLGVERCFDKVTPPWKLAAAARELLGLPPSDMTRDRRRRDCAPEARAAELAR